MSDLTETLTRVVDPILKELPPLPGSNTTVDEHTMFIKGAYTYCGSLADLMKAQLTGSNFSMVSSEFKLFPVEAGSGAYVAWIPSGQVIDAELAAMTATGFSHLSNASTTGKELVFKISPVSEDSRQMVPVSAVLGTPDISIKVVGKCRLTIFIRYVRLGPRRTFVCLN